MVIRTTLLSDIDPVMEIYRGARKFMKDNGNPDQWINGYPDRELVREDILDGSSYVCIDHNQIVGVFRFTLGEDPTYRKIYDGEWLNEEAYGVVHRIASASHKKGVGSFCLDWCFDQCKNIRIDTHHDNYIMQNLLIKLGFKRCGIIHLEDGAERIAFQKC